MVHKCPILYLEINASIPDLLEISVQWPILEFTYHDNTILNIPICVYKTDGISKAHMQGFISHVNKLKSY